MTVYFKMIIVSCSLAVYTLGAQEAVKYSVSFPNAAHHEAQVTVEFSGIKSHPLQLLMSRSSPGRYALHEFAKNVYNLKAYDRSGKELPVNRPDIYEWDINSNSAYVKVSYTVFGDLCDGTYLAIDNSHAHMNIPATFIRARGFEEQPIEIRFNPPDKKWQVATQLKPTADPYLFTAPNMDYFMDSPVELADLEWREWLVTSAGKTYKIRLALHQQDSDSALSAIEKIIRVLVNENMRVFGELPDYDYGTYTFICCYMPWVARDGMEHRNSTIISGPFTISKDYFEILGTISHEFFHCWNVERLRPASLQPFDFSRANMSSELWFAEGFTNYFGTLARIRAGLFSADSYADRLTFILNYVLNNPGLSINSAVDMSRYAPFVDAGRSNDPKNLDNIYLSYYILGDAIATGLDLSLRQKFPGLSLDDYMRAAWQKFGRNEIPYTIDDLQQLLADVSGDSVFATTFFNSSIFGHSLPDYKKLLTPAGFIVEENKKDSAWAGDGIEFKDGKMIVASPAKIGTPLYRAGLDQGDTIRMIAGEAPGSAKQWQEWLAAHKPAQTVEISFSSRGMEKTGSLTLQGNPVLKIVPFEQRGQEITDQVKTFRRDWLGLAEDDNPAGLQRFCPRCHRAFPFRFEYCTYDGAALQLTP